MSIHRGDLYRVRSTRGEDPRRSRIHLVVSRTEFLQRNYSTAICAPVYTVGGVSEAELPLGPNGGLKHESFARCDELTSLPRSALTDFVGSLSPKRMPELNRALAIALDIQPEDIEDL